MPLLLPLSSILVTCLTLVSVVERSPYSDLPQTTHCSKEETSILSPLMASFHPPSGQLHQQTFGLARPTPEPSFGSFHPGSTHQQSNLPRYQNSQALPHLKSQAVKNPLKIPLQNSRKQFSPGRPRKVPRRPLMRKRFMATDNGRHVITRNANMNSKWNFLSGEFDLKKDQSLGSSGNKKSKWRRMEEGLKVR